MRGQAPPPTVCLDRVFLFPRQRWYMYKIIFTTPYVLPTLPGYITNQVGTSVNKVPNPHCLNQEVLVDEKISQKSELIKG